ncbi:hypothetical protein D1Y84_07745 [Acidipila sp. EB88]|nr:hypothetical protein D1Y84_07745 [Acidipila sp. EB88]
MWNENGLLVFLFLWWGQDAGPAGDVFRLIWGCAGAWRALGRCRGTARVLGNRRSFASLRMAKGDEFWDSRILDDRI